MEDSLSITINILVKLTLEEPGEILILVKGKELPPVPGVWKFENPHYRVKKWNCQNVCENDIKPMEKQDLNQTCQLGEKSPKPPQNVTFLKNSIFGCFFGRIGKEKLNLGFRHSRQGRQYMDPEKGIYFYFLLTF